LAKVLQYYLYNYYLVCALLSHGYHVTTHVMSCVVTVTYDLGHVILSYTLSCIVSPKKKKYKQWLSHFAKSWHILSCVNFSSGFYFCPFYFITYFSIFNSFSLWSSVLLRVNSSSSSIFMSKTSLGRPSSILPLCFLIWYSRFLHSSLFFISK